MKLLLYNNNSLNLSISSQGFNTKIEDLYIVGCPNINAYNIAYSILLYLDNILDRIRIDIGDRTDSYNTLMLFSGLLGITSDGEYQDKPVLIGTWSIPGWVLRSQYTDANNTFSSELTISANSVAEDSVLENYIHFNQSLPPQIELASFNLSDFNKIYVGQGNSNWEDSVLLLQYLNNPFWAEYAETLDTWYNYLNERDIDTTTYDIVPWIMSDRVDYIDTQISDATYIMVDAAYILKPTNNIVVMGNEDTGFKGNSEGIGFGSTEFISGDTYQTDSTERLYEADLTPGNHRYFLDKVEIPETPGETINEIGNVTLFGNSSSKVMAKLYGCTLKSGNTILANYVPVRRKSDNYPGLYDKINNIFKFNSKYYCDDATRYLTTEDNLHITTEDGEEILI